MSYRIRLASSAAALAMVFATPLFGQSVLLRMNPAEGLITKYVIGTETYMDSPMIPTDGPVATTEMHQTQTILSVDGDVVEVQTTVESMDVTSAMPGADAGVPDMDGSTYTIKMDTRGRLVELSDMGDLPAEAEPMVSQMAGGSFFQLPEEEVSPGDTWSAGLDMDLPAGGGGSMTLDMELTYTLVSVDGDLASVSFEGPITMTGSAQGMTMDGTGGMSGTAVFDVGKGRIDSTESEMSIDMNVMGMTMGMSTMNTMTIVP